MKKLITTKTLIGLTILSCSLPTVLMAQSEALTTLAECNEANAVAGGDTNEIAITGKSYTPRCLKVKVGASVSIQASSKHPLSAMADINGASNPFSNTDDTSLTQTRQMTTTGAFGYYCTKHGDPDGSGMAGLILVTEN